MSEVSLHPAAVPLAQLLAECEARRQRRSGPGGQHRNKVETAVILTHLPTGIRGEASERRSQEQNRQAAVVRLRLNLAIDVRAATGETPSERWQGRVRGGRIEISSNHDDFAAIIAEALDVLHCREWDTKSASAFLSITSSQLTKLLAREPRALAKLNDERAARGFKPLR